MMILYFKSDIEICQDSRKQNYVIKSGKIMCNDVHTQLDDFSCGIFYDVDVNNWVLNSLPNVKSFRTELNVVSVKI